MALTQVQSGLLESGAALNNIGAGNITPAYLNTQAQYTGFKNRLINGDMTISQRNGTSSVNATDGLYTLDRWRCGASANSVFSVQQSTAAPAGFSNSLLVTSLAATSLGTNSNFEMMQFIEGFNTADLGFGTANAQTVTLSFWVRSSLTGTFGGSLMNGTFNRSYPFSYTISAANTWEQKSVTITGDTAGTWVGSTNGIGIVVNFGLGVGTGRSGTAGAWASSEFYSATGAVSVVGTSGATWQVTGVQLEKGQTATSFDVLPISTEIALCQRYYEIGSYDGVGGFISAAGVSVYSWVSFAVRKRGNPTMSAPANWTTQASGGATTSRTFGNAGVAGNGFAAQLGGSDPRAFGDWIANIEL
jgi:hypothetical protein